MAANLLAAPVFVPVTAINLKKNIYFNNLISHIMEVQMGNF